jgi:capsular polysaccharide transport system permease protein
MIGEIWATKKDVWGAILMREILTRWGRRNLGFAWLFAEPLVFAFPVIAMWHMIRPATEHGLPIIAMIWSGYLPLLVFRHITGKAIYVIRSNIALLYHHQITPLDIFIGRCGLEAIGNMAAVAFSFFILYALGFLEWPLNMPLFLLGHFYMVWWSVAVALLVAAGSERTEIVEHIWSVASYMYMPVSGFMYLAVWLPASIREMALTVMPSLHAYEMIRAGMLGNSIQTFFDVGYVSYVLAVLTLIGLWLMYNVRQHLEIVE